MVLAIQYSKVVFGCAVTTFSVWFLKKKKMQKKKKKRNKAFYSYVRVFRWNINDMKFKIPNISKFVIYVISIAEESIICSVGFCSLILSFSEEKFRSRETEIEQQDKYGPEGRRYP